MSGINAPSHHVIAICLAPAATELGFLHTMSVSNYVCVCKRSFTAQNYYIQHQHSCVSTKKRLSSAIASLKEFVGRRKKPRTSQEVAVHVHDVAPPEALMALPIPSPNPSGGVGSDDHGVGTLDGGEGMCLAQRRTRRQNCQLPLRFRDVLPQPPPTVPAELGEELPEHVGRVVDAAARPMRTMFRTPPNIFGLVRQYFSARPPCHDPEEYVTIADLSFIPGTIQDGEVPLEPSSYDFHPYPNRSSFRLGDWYWNHGVQKSQGDFKKLLDILGDPSFNNADVTTTKWKNINFVLGSNKYDEGDGDEWEDEDAGWHRSPISIEVPSLRTTENPGSRVYKAAAHLYHRSLVAVLRKKLANPRDDKLFHYEPYQLRWAPPHMNVEVSIYGDLYTSPVFHEAHTALQGSPGEPDCDLPRVIAALMFWSDATQLTSFGNSKLWPTYMYFGNESKYRRCKPLCHLSNHVAYFETVCPLIVRSAACHNMYRIHSSRTRSKIWQMEMA
jgi:hypothetical protein